MRNVTLALIALLLLSGCDHKKKPVPQAEDAGAPQIATSLDDAGLPVDKSDEITAIDAATGDASGMPHDGGAAIAHARTETAKSTDAKDPAPASGAVPPLVTPAVPAVTTPPAPASGPN